MDKINCFQSSWLNGAESTRTRTRTQTWQITPPSPHLLQLCIQQIRRRWGSRGNRRSGRSWRTEEETEASHHHGLKQQGDAGDGCCSSLPLSFTQTCSSSAPRSDLQRSFLRQPRNICRRLTLHFLFPVSCFWCLEFDCISLVLAPPPPPPPGCCC